MLSPLVSIIIPTYSRPDRLSRAIDSVLNQSYKNLEIIVVDDNGCDSVNRPLTKKVMEDYRNKNNVKYICHDENKNGAAARNTGIKYAQGQYITFLDDDDEYYKFKVEMQVECMESRDNTWGACYVAYKKINSENMFQYSYEQKQGDLFVDALMKNLFINAGSNILVRKEVVEEIRGFDEDFERNQDLEFLVRILKKYKLAYINSCQLVIHYEIREITRTYEESLNTNQLFIRKFQHDINNLNKGNRKRVHTMYALNDIRLAIQKKRYKEALGVMISRRVNPYTIIRYIKYLLTRYLTKASYGFNL